MVEFAAGLPGDSPVARIERALENDREKMPREIRTRLQERVNNYKSGMRSADDPGNAVPVEPAFTEEDARLRILLASM